MNYSKSIMLSILLLFIQACQSTSDSPKQKSNSMIIDENNYVKISQYNYTRFTIKKNRQHLPANSKYRSYPGTIQVQSTKDLLQISALSLDDQNKERIMIKQNGTTVIVEVNRENDSVLISYDDGIKTLQKEMTFDMFQNLEGSEA